jgi:DNA polymerase V
MSTQPIIALVDCNNFYVSCERLFRPDLWDKPVAVLSNLDGCLISRSKEVKSLLIPMAIPVFKVAHLVKKHRIHLFSANFPLYGDISSRIMSLLETFSAHTEIYSIDEAFLDLTGICQQDPVSYGIHIKHTIQRDVGIPVCVGMAPTKTLAKLANYAAKKWDKTGGVLDLSCPQRRERLMRSVSVREVWGIGSRLSQQLAQLGIHTAWDLAKQPVQQMRDKFSVVMARTIMELNGIPCLELEEIASDKQQIICSSSFKRPLTSIEELSQALAGFCSRAAEKLRMQKSVTSCITVFIQTNPFNPQEPQYQRSAALKLATGTQDTRILISAAKQIVRSIYKPNYRYQKCGIQLSDIRPQSMQVQADLFADNQRIDQLQLMATLDKINHRFPNAVSLAATGLNKKTWQFKPERISKRYTTDWNELASVKCE